MEKNTPLPCSSTEVFQLINVEQELVHMKFHNVVNDKEESIGDLWLGIDDTDVLDEVEKIPQLEITLSIDENNLVSVEASLLEYPSVGISGTLSRGKADEKLFLSLEQSINDANKKGYDEFVVIDLLRRTRSILHTIRGVVDSVTGEVDESLYKQAEAKITKAVIIAESGETTYTKIYYAEAMIDSYGMLISPALKTRISKRIETLRNVDDDGSYDQTIKEQQKLADILNEPDLDWVHLLMTIEKAVEICHKTDKTKAAQFGSAIDKLIHLLRKDENSVAVEELLQKIMPEVNKVLDAQDRVGLEIHKDLRK